MESTLIETGVNGKGVLLTKGELDLLFLLYQQRYLTLSQMFKLISLDSDIKENSFRNRVNSKFVPAAILIAKEYSLGRVGFMFKYYRIGARGLTVLHEKGYISAEQMVSYRENFNPIRNVEHYLATQEIVTECIKECIKNDRSYLTYSRGMTIFHKGMTSMVKPDWTVETEGTIIYFELDTGTETIKELKEKVEKYSVLFKSNSSKNKVLLIVELDESFLTRHALGTRQKRIANMKNGLFELFHEKEQKELVYVMGLERAMDFIRKIVINEIVTKEDKNAELQNTALILEMFHQNFAYSLSKISCDLPIKGAYEMYELTHKKSGLKENCIFYYGEEGNLETSNDLFHLNNMIHNNQLPHGCMKVCCFYKNEKSLLDDIQAALYGHIMFADMDKWNNELQRKPSYRKQINQFMWEVREFG